jgi:hypothetical protein
MGIEAVRVLPDDNRGAGMMQVVDHLSTAELQAG